MNELAPYNAGADACARGCTIATIDGREPSPATHGILCTRCILQLRDALDLAPHAIGTLRGQIGRKPGAVDTGDRVTGSRDQPIPIRPAPMARADDLHALVWTWTAEVLRTIGGRGPQLAHDLIASDADAGPIKTAMSSDVAQLFAREACGWLVYRLPRIVHLAISPDLAEELTTATRRAAGLAGLNGPSTWAAKRTCSVCDTRTVRVEWLPDGGANVRCTFCHNGVTLDAIDIDRIIPGERQEAAA